MTETATELLLAAGMANLLVGALSGFSMGLLRQRGVTDVPKYLTMVHLNGLMQGPILIAIGYAMTISSLPNWVDVTAAGVLALASALLIAKDTLNWRQHVRDEFAEQPVGLRIGQVFGPLYFLGLGLATAAVLSGF